jgi:hypothetical protein
MGGFAPSEGWTAGNLKGGEEFRIIFSSTPKIPNPRFSDPLPTPPRAVGFYHHTF